MFYKVALILSALAVLSCSHNKVPTKNSLYKKERQRLEEQSFQVDQLKGFDYTQTKTLQKVFSRQAKRSILVSEFKMKGYLGEASNGFLKIRNSKKLSKKNKIKLKKLVKSENSDRKRLYIETARSQKHSKKTLRDLRFKSFKAYLAADPKGVWFYSNDNWQKK